ncbi:hypothetical protein FLACOL_02284 [Flavobacterium columnare]|uniref:DUF2339 domain-containing protein n=2 Tax=Flavobacterium TaxID=237 RepID=A0ABW8PN46_9FLAO|nr:DUF2339 domain-containing protein [Flavobacterium columnare]SPE78269.1 hypothetical protein FLACOL_02284 [Flavobacterium columnare]
MDFWIFLLLILFIILYSQIKDLKKRFNNALSDINKLKSENNFLKKELESIKYKLEEGFITTSPVIPETEKPLEVVQEQGIENISRIDVEFVPPSTTEEKQIVAETINTPIELSQTVSQTPVATPTSVEFIEEPQSKTIQEVVPTEINKINSIEEKEAIPFTKQPTKEEIYQESAFSIFLKKAEKQFADNWTGILGTAIMVLGIGYLSIYTALKVSPFFRILILWLYAGLFVGSYYILKKKEKWVNTGLWLRSAGASLFLFSCFGASQIDALTFISNTTMGYALIGLGIGVNLYVGYIIKKQTFLSLHVVLSILILCVIPDKLLITFLLAAITATIGILLSYKEKWEYHLLIVIIGFVIFDIWFNAQGTKLTATENIFAILGIITVAGSCLFMPYRAIYENSYFDKPAFITHLTNWLLFATGLLLHATGSKFKIVVLFLGAIICFFMALKARKKKVYWLYNLDGMVSFILAGLSIIMLNDWNIGLDIIACILYSLVLVCLFIVYKEKEVLLHKILLSVNHFMVVALTIFFALLVTNNIEANQSFTILFSSILLFCIAIAVPIISQVKKEYLEVDSLFLEKSISINGLLAMIFSTIVILKWNALYGNSFYYALIAFAGIWFFLKWKFDAKTFEIGRILYYLLTILIGLVLINIQDKTYQDVLFSIGLFAIITLNWYQKEFYKNDFYVRFSGIVGVNILLLILNFKYLSHFEILQIFSLFSIGLLNHEFLWVAYKRKNLCSNNQSILYLFYFLFIIIGTLTFIFKTTTFSNTNTALISIGVVLIESYVLFGKRFRKFTDDNLPNWEKLNVFNTEFIIITTLIFGISCIRITYLPIYIASLGILFFIAFQKFTECKRFLVYSFALTVAATVLMVSTALKNNTTDSFFYVYLSQFISFTITLAYSYLYITDKNIPEDKNYSFILPYLQNIGLLFLLFIQLDTNCISLFLMLLAISNYFVITRLKVKIQSFTISIIGLLSITNSLNYSMLQWNHFSFSDWFLQLGAITLGFVLVILLDKIEKVESLKSYNQITINAWLSFIMFSQLEHKWLPIFWCVVAILNLYLYHKKISKVKDIHFVYYLLANLHLAFFSFNFYETKFLIFYLLIFILLAVYIYLSYKWMEEFKLKNSLLIYPATLSIGSFLYLTFDKGILTFFWILEALGLLILGIALKEKYFRYVSLLLVGLCLIRLMFFDLSNADFLIRALVLLGVGVVLLVMNTLFKKYKDRFE